MGKSYCGYEYIWKPGNGSSYDKYRRHDRQTKNSTGYRHEIVMNHFRNMINQKILLSLKIAIAECVKCKATDPRDKVFALQSITNETLKPLISPDYAKSTRQVYIDSATYFLSQEDPLYILPFASRGYPRRFENLPSWVLGRSNPPKLYPFGIPMLGTNYCASGNTSGTNKTRVRFRGGPSDPFMLPPCTDAEVCSSIKARTTTREDLQSRCIA